MDRRVLDRLRRRGGHPGRRDRGRRFPARPGPGESDCAYLRSRPCARRRARSGAWEGVHDDPGCPAYVALVEGDPRVAVGGGLVTEVPVDEPARRAIREDLDRNLFVEAGWRGRARPGPGRTHRRARHQRPVRPGAPGHHHLHRGGGGRAPRPDLGDVGEGGAGGGDGARPPPSGPTRHSGPSTGAAISTLHGFARRILAAPSLRGGAATRVSTCSIPASRPSTSTNGGAASSTACWPTPAPAGAGPPAGLRGDDGRPAVRGRGVRRQLGPAGRPRDRGPAGPGGRRLGRAGPLDHAARSTIQCTVQDHDELVHHIGSLAGFHDEVRAAADKGSVLQLLAGSPKLTCSG